METIQKTAITVNALVNAPIEKVWKYWTTPHHITKWNFASDDWCSPRAENDLRTGGKFSYRMEAKDGSAGFDFEGVYDQVEINRKISYSMADGRKVMITFTPNGEQTSVAETFETETENSVELQRAGWQAILDNFKKHTETPVQLETITMEIRINAPVEKVYQTMINASSYNQWTSAFNPTSHFIGNWETGSKILFIGTDEQGNKGGMVSRIAENIPDKFISIEHLGILNGDEEITSGPAVEEWAGSNENYTFTDEGGTTLLRIDLDSNEEYKSYFTETWPKALQILKDLCENTNS